MKLRNCKNILTLSSEEQTGLTRQQNDTKTLSGLHAKKVFFLVIDTAVIEF